jgi:hypothetical protein
MKQIPTPTELHPRLSELEGKRNALHAEKTAKVAEAATIRARIQESPSNGNVADNRVRIILGQAPLPDTAPDMARLDRLLLELNDLNRAIGILDGAIQNERDVASRLVCKTVAPEADRLGKKFAVAFIELHTAHSEYNAFLDAVEDTGARISSLGRVWPNALGHPKDASGPYHYALREFVDAGYLVRSQVPEAVR